MTSFSLTVLNNIYSTGPSLDLKFRLKTTNLIPSKHPSRDISTLNVQNPELPLQKQLFCLPIFVNDKSTFLVDQNKRSQSHSSLCSFSHTDIQSDPNLVNSTFKMHPEFHYFSLPSLSLSWLKPPATS